MFTPNYWLWVTVNVATKRPLQLLHERHFPGEEKKVMYIMFTEWRCDIRYKTAFSCLDFVECAGWRPKSRMKVVSHGPAPFFLWTTHQRCAFRYLNESQWSACRVSFNASETLTVASWMVITGTNSIFASQCY